jgi:acyl carrier protein
MLTEQQVRMAIASVKERFDATALPLDADFGDSGIDSLDHASILLALQEEHGLTVPPEMETEVTSIRKILDFARSVRR